MNKAFEDRISAITFNDFFFQSVASSLIKSESTSFQPFQTLPTLSQFCTSELASRDSCTIPEMAVYEVGKYTNKLKNEKSTDLDTVNALILKTYLPYIVQPVSYILQSLH